MTFPHLSCRIRWPKSSTWDDFHTALLKYENCLLEQHDSVLLI
jgi:hypothetical protein